MKLNYVVKNSYFFKNPEALIMVQEILSKKEKEKKRKYVNGKGITQIFSL